MGPGSPWRSDVREPPLCRGWKGHPTTLETFENSSFSMPTHDPPQTPLGTPQGPHRTPSDYSGPPRDGPGIPTAKNETPRGLPAPNCLDIVCTDSCWITLLVSGTPTSPGACLEGGLYVFWVRLGDIGRRPFNITASNVCMNITAYNIHMNITASKICMNITTSNICMNGTASHICMNIAHTMYA